MIECLNELWRTGRLVALHPIASPEPNRGDLVAWIQDADAQYREQLPSHAPPIDVDVAIWSVQQFYRASQLMVHRELGEEFIESGLEAEPAEIKMDPSNARDSMLAIASVHYSVDLFFRFLPDLHRLVKAAMASDPLLKQIDAWLERWPLSAARIADRTVDKEKLEPILANRCLRIMYIERVLDRVPIPQSAIDHWTKIHAQYEWKSFDSHH